MTVRKNCVCVLVCVWERERKKREREREKREEREREKVKMDTMTCIKIYFISIFSDDHEKSTSDDFFVFYPNLNLKYLVALKISSKGGSTI